MSKKLLLSAIFSAGALGLTANAGEMQVLNEEDLDDVSAQGLQVIENDNRNFRDLNGQQNNLDSVQMNGNAQRAVQIAGLVNAAKTSINTAINLLKDGPVSDQPPKDDDDDDGTKAYSRSFSQANIQLAMNHMNTSNDDDAEEEIALALNINKETQVVINRGNIVDQDNNNNSVQLNDNAQRGASGGKDDNDEATSALFIANAAISSVNNAISVFVAGDVSGTEGGQLNKQSALNMGNYAEAQAGEAPVAVAGNGETGPTQLIWNEYGEETDDGIDPYTITDQDNNNNSVQLNDNAQRGAIALQMYNVANSAYNTAFNAISVGDVSESSIGQTNEQGAENHVNIAKAEAMNGTAIAGNLNKQTQNVHNAVGEEFDGFAVIEDQDNNNNSVQLNNNAQRDASALDMTNSAISAGNTGINVMSTGSVSTSTLSQLNSQSARNFDNEAYAYTGDPDANTTAIAGNAEINENPGQYIHTVHATVIEQDNNNNSVQLNDNAQRDASVLSGINMAQSAVNSGINILFIDGDVADSEVNQTNMQYASNHNNFATADGVAVAVNLNKQKQVIDNCFCSDFSDTDQDNNMNSVQLNDNAQRGLKGWIMVNAATSAVNAGTNIAVVSGSVSGSSFTQTNVQTAINFSNKASGKIAVTGNWEGVMPFPVLLDLDF